MTGDHRFFSSRGAALNTIQSALDGAEVVRIATAYFEPSGYQCLSQVLSNKETRLLIGRGDNSSDQIDRVLKEFTDSLIKFDFESRTRAIESLYHELKQNRLMVSVGDSPQNHSSLDPRYLYHHAKVYIADKKRAVIGSANLSRTGLIYSIEAGITIENKSDVTFFVEKFDEYFAKAQTIADELIQILEAWLTHHHPFKVYARSLLELHGLPDTQVPDTLPELATYQKPVVSRILQAIQDTGGAMLVASTGLGKTIMAAHTLAYLRMQNYIDSAVVITPAGLKEMWRRTMRMARTSSVEFSYHTLSADDWKKNRSVDILDYELNKASSKTLIIIDESHHLRNEEDQKGEIKLRNQRLLDAVQRGAHILLMTATPYSRDISDLNSQLKLLPKPVENHSSPNNRLFANTNWEVDRAYELSELSPCVVLTAPSVVRYFSHQDDDGERYVLFSGNLKRYFPRHIHLHNVNYINELDSLLLELMTQKLLLARKSFDENQSELFENKLNKGRRDPLFESRVLHQFCSSCSQIESLFSKLAFEGGFDKMRFANQDILTQFVYSKNKTIQNITSNHTEAKLQKLIEIIVQAKDEKVVVFCVYRQTARYLAQSLGAILKKTHIACTVDMDSDQLERTIKSFAPVANESLFESKETKNIQVLIATGALAEGFNLQDASYLVNFDLPWTVLTLAQRMGRILRPWHTPREIHIFNLLPETMQNKNLHMAMNWKNRLLHRNKEHSSFADIPVMVEKDNADSGVELASLANILQEMGDVNLGLSEVISFIEKAEDLKTSSFLDDIALLSIDEIEELMKIPGGMRSSKKYKKNLLYLLLDYHNLKYPVLFDADAKIVLNSEKTDLILQILRCSHDEAPLDPWQLPDVDTLDKWQNKCIQSWALQRLVDPQEISICCLMVLGEK